MLVVLYLRVHRARKRRAKNQLAVAAALKTLKRGDEAYLETLQMAFDLFDNDSSGEIDHKELRNLLHTLHPQLSRGQIREVIHRLKVHHHFVNGKVLFEDFVATYEDFETIVAELPDEAHLWPEGKSRRGMSFLSRMGSSRIAVQPNNAMARNGKSAAARRAEKHGIVRN